MHGSLDPRLAACAGHPMCSTPRFTPAHWQFATDGIRVADRPEYWRQAIGQALNVDVSVHPLHEVPLGIRMALQDWGSFRLLCLQGNAHRAVRRGPARGDGVSLVLQFDGVCEFGDRHRRVTLGPGDAALMPPDFERVAAPRSSFTHALVDLRWDFIAEVLPQWRSLLCHRLPHAHPAAGALAELARWMLRHGESLPDEAREGLASSLTALLPGLAEASPDAASTSADAGPGPMARAQRLRVEAFIREHLADAGLDVAFIARELGLSVRYVHKLFADGPSVMQWVQEQRLLACRQELAQRGTRPVSSIAYGWGFASPSHFSRAYRRCFGVSPSQA